MNSISKPLFLTMYSFYFGGSILLNFLIIFDIKVHDNSYLPLVIYTYLLLIFIITSMVLLYKMWSVIQDGRARITPGKAIGFCFIPLFNIFWIFEIIWGFSKNFNKYIQRHEVDTPDMSQDFFLLLSCFPIINFILSKIGMTPINDTILLIFNYGICMIVVNEICDGVNAVLHHNVLLSKVG